MSTIYQLKIELAGSHPKIWRRLIVESTTSFDQLHDILQISMGWNNEYPFEFIVNKTTVRDFGGEVDMGDDPYDRDIADTYLDELITMVKSRFTYIYNFHDHWEHQIVVEDMLPSGEAPVYPVCTGGEGNCPPDDGGGISRYQEMLKVLADKKHPEHNTLRKRLGDREDFNMHEVNAQLRNYMEEWDEIYREAEEDFADADDEDDDGEFNEVGKSEYERLKYLQSPPDVLKDEWQKRSIEDWFDEALDDKSSMEHKALTRLLSQGHTKEKSKAMILEAFRIEWFYDLKYGTGDLEDRYQYNLGRLPETPQEVPSLECAVDVLDNCTKGIPFAAIEYLHNDTSREATAAIVKALNNFSDHQYCWRDCVTTPIWYSLAAEGHICEELIAPVIGFYNADKHSTDWLRDQGQFLIGKLAQKYPDITVQKILAAMEKEASDKSGHPVFYLFDAFDFCNIDKYKDRLIALLKRDDIDWHDMLASTIAHLQIREGLPVLKEQLRVLNTGKAEEHHRSNWRLVEIEEAIEELEKGESLFPDIDTPLCLKRGTTWREEFADAEEYFYDNGTFGEDSLNIETSDGFDPYLEFADDLTYQQPIIKENKPGRNDPCPCGSGKKYKKCCIDKDIGVK